MRNKFCVKCGTEKNLVNEFCKDCFKEEKTLLKEFKEVKIIICDSCKKYLHRNAWKRAFSEDIKKNLSKVTSELFREKIVENYGVKLKEIEVNVNLPKVVKSSSGSIVNVEVDINVKGYMKGTLIDENYTVPLKASFSKCNICKKKGGRYFEAKLQIRPKNDKVLTFVKNYCKNKKMFISDIAEAEYGYDVYLSDQKEARNFGSLLKKKFGGEMKQSKKLFGKKDGRDIYRATLVFRLDS